jgi:hypothetical protein
MPHADSPGTSPTPQNKLFIGVPCYGGMVSHLTARGLISLGMSLHASGVPYEETNFIANESLVTRARNRIVANFLKTDCTHLLFIDADIGFTAGDVDALTRGGFDVVGGVYPMKVIDWRRVADLVKAGCDPGDLAERAGLYTANATASDIQEGTVTVIRKNGRRYVEVQDVPTGFLLIKRAALVAYIDRYRDEIAYVADYAPYTGQIHFDVFGVGLDPMTSKDGRQRVLMQALLESVRAGGDTREIVERIDALKAEPPAARYLSEDYHFSRRWQAMGGRTFVALDCKLSHVGMHVFPGDVGAGLLASPMPVAPGT